MATINQLIRKPKLFFYLNNKPKLNIIKFYLNNKPKILYKPQSRGVTISLRICTPRKPNSARRKVVKVKLSTKKFALVYIPGSPHNLRKFSKVLINGNRCRDLPYVNYSCIRGVYDFEGLSSKKKRRSVYGVKKDPLLKIHIRRKLRNKLN